jgi:Tfp pilus assembly protein PilF
VVFISVAFFLIGCYSKENFVQRNSYSQPAGTDGNISYDNVNQFLSSIRKVDRDMEAKYQLARHFQKTKQHQIAIEELKEILLIDPTFVKAYNALGVSYDQLWDFKNAIRSYQLAIKLDPNLDYVHNNLGFAYLLKGDYDFAIDSFLKAIALDEQSKRFRNNLGLAYAKKGEFDRALEQFRLTGDESSANYKLGQILFKEGNYEMARHYHAKSFQNKGAAQVTAAVSSAGEENESGVRIIRKSIRQTSQATQQQNQTEVKEANPDSSSNRVRSRMSPATDITEKQTFSAENSDDEAKFSGSAQLKRNDFFVEIEISNGNGVDGMARRLGNYLIKKGFRVTRLKNASCFNHETTKIFYYANHLRDVSRLLEEIPVQFDTENVIQLKHADNRIKILLGKDMIPYDRVISGAESVKKPS